jgi:hypothetical protein
MSSVLLRDFLKQLSICSEKAACIARHIRFMHTDFNNMIQEKQCNHHLFFSFVLFFNLKSFI